MFSKKLAGVIVAGTVAAIGAAATVATTDARPYTKVKPGALKPGVFQRACAPGFRKSQGHHSYRCSMTVYRICPKGKIRGAMQLVKTGANTYQVRYRCMNPPH